MHRILERAAVPPQPPHRPARRPTGLRSLIASGALLAAGIVPLTLAATAGTAHAAMNSGDVIANMFMWNWNSVGAECTNVLGPDGYGGVQVSPPQDSVSITGHPWWEVYQPTDYNLSSRMGSEAQFQTMVSTCRAAGVKVYVDTVINHMTGQGSTSYGGTSFTKFNYPGVYTSSNFHYYPANCPESDNQIHDWNSYTEVTQCELLQLSDLATEQDSVRSTIAGYLNKLLSYGVSGFRVDAAKHVGQTDLSAIEGKLNKTVDGAAPYFALEVYPGSSGQLAPAAFESQGNLLGFDYAYAVKNDFNGSISNLNSLTSGLLGSSNEEVFVENHDTERDGSTLNYKSGAINTLATEFELAYGYGTPQVFSGYDFTGHDDSPPADSSGMVTNTTCGSGWECTDRITGVANMVGWHNAVAGGAVANWYSDGSNLIAFSRGGKGWIALNNENSVQTRTFATGLPAGTYCDLIHSSTTAGTCTGAAIVVDSSGNATVSVPAKDSVALDVAAVSGPSPSGSASASASSSASASPSASASASPSSSSTGSSGATETFTVSGAPTGAPLYLVGSIGALGSWAPASAAPMTQSGSNWTVTVGGLPTSTTVQYKYIAKDSNGNVTWEPGSNMSLTTPSSGSASVSDTWTGSSSTVTATFNGTATTWYGQNVYVVGSIPALGSWNAASAVALSSTNYPVWSGSTTLPPNTTFQYKYIKKDPNGAIEWESGANRTASTGSSGTATYTDSWNGTASSIENVTFNEYRTTVVGQNVYLVGDISALGGWNASNAILLSSSGYPTWSKTLQLPPGQSFQYKFVIKDSSGTVTWESGANRTFTTGTSGTDTISDTWQ
ncbi:alpha-amylase [Streptacidiphilus sp. MAP12-16]|uniref:carbohydrate-binding module family 20 domain-containing protein n=1 Tax=Streptacidiphilus sp. MAP12-16 TaxID=3156300 RepID=UPI003519C534